MRRILLTTLLLSMLLFITGCGNKDDELVDDEKEVAIENVEEEKAEREYLVVKYFEFEKGDSFENIKSKTDKEGLEIKDSGEFEAEAGYKKREVNILDSENELNLVFRDDKLASKTFTYNKDDVNSTWFYSNYYDILEGKDQEDEKHGIWKESKKEIECMDEYDLNIKLQDEI